MNRLTTGRNFDLVTGVDWTIPVEAEKLIADLNARVALREERGAKVKVDVL